MRNLYLYGASGHGKVIVEIAELLNQKVSGFIDANPNIITLLEYKVFTEIPTDTTTLLISIGNNALRKKIAEKHNAYSYQTLIHPQAIISSRAQIGIGSVVMGGVTMNSGTKIGKHCIINTNSSIDHDCLLADYVHISPNAALAGNVTVGEGTQIGIGACVKQNIKIGKWCTIGAGAVIIKDIPDGKTVVGNPGRFL